MDLALAAVAGFSGNLAFLAAALTLLCDTLQLREVGFVGLPFINAVLIIKL